MKRRFVFAMVALFAVLLVGCDFEDTGITLYFETGDIEITQGNSTFVYLMVNPSDGIGGRKVSFKVDDSSIVELLTSSGRAARIKGLKVGQETILRAKVSGITNEGLLVVRVVAPKP
ncbi:MAG: hypothetical protein FWD91_05635 [Treponema sp.]|nr:hypothetical protein [Treponema sp.]